MDLHVFIEGALRPIIYRLNLKNYLILCAEIDKKMCKF